MQGRIFFFSSRRRHTRFDCDWSSDVCSSDLAAPPIPSATTKSDPRSPTSCSRTSGRSEASWRVRSATMKRSSLWSRVLPRSVLARSEEHTSELQSQSNLVCRLLLEKKKNRESQCTHL